jgi:prepilin-type processing-associated H-X9-DG protein/prepilin-type N-terminal cleavage/methylation domain-containing protein
MKTSIYPQNQDASPRNTAFTLIEVLAVISVISLLASLLLPALQRAKRSAQRAQCLSIQKQWTLGFHVYAESNDDWLPREGFHPAGEVVWNNWAQVANPASADAWYNALAQTINVAPASTFAPRQERDRFYGRGSFFHCPSTRFPGLIKSETALFSLAMNSHIITPPNPKVRLTSLSWPARTPLMLDNLLDEEIPVVSQQAKDNLGQPAAFANRFAGRRHGVGGNIAFADGHVSFFRGEDVVETKGINIGGPILPPGNIFWFAQ